VTPLELNISKMVADRDSVPMDYQ